MGAHTFFTRANGEDAKSAFSDAVEDAQYHYGQGGYTGTIAEKTSFTRIPDDEVGDTDPAEYASQLIDEQDSRIDSKWGPAGCIHVEEDTYLFFGWASA
ncbi:MULTISPECIES: hypothetical protein [Halobacteriales]|jgi:hypothetical protein|uniref:Uncharacterized protein n=4 Tax=Halobacteriales TaxID=2235 RepID=A0A368MZR5_9EURY|nr:MULTISPECIES: hypothetical protein [Halobacteria]RCU43718.1 hypothetical protein DU504_17660 [Haloplanus salinus]RJX50643.1 hypothetical protein DP106_05110 [Halonotius pteroides]RNJ22579.1 hypothetical protein Nmn1133_13120 [Salella cibi]